MGESEGRGKAEEKDGEGCELCAHVTKGQTEKQYMESTALPRSDTRAGMQPEFVVRQTGVRARKGKGKRGCLGWGGGAYMIASNHLVLVLNVRLLLHEPLLELRDFPRQPRVVATARALRCLRTWDVGCIL